MLNGQNTGGKNGGGLAPFPVRFAEKMAQPQFAAGSYGDETTADTTGGQYEDPHSDT